MKYGYIEKLHMLSESLQQLRTYIAILPERLQPCNEQEVSERPPGKWSKKEILGHLIDSALDNLNGLRMRNLCFAVCISTVRPEAIGSFQDVPPEHS